MAHPSAPIAALSAVYIGSRSMRAGISWLVLGFCNAGTETLMDFVASIGVERLTDGRLNAAGLMSTIFYYFSEAGAWCSESGAVSERLRKAVACEKQHMRDAKA